MTQAYGDRRYRIDFDRGAFIRDLPDGRTIHQYQDKPGELWRDAFGNVLPDQPSKEN
jgi:hypothetical protein